MAAIFESWGGVRRPFDELRIGTRRTADSRIVLGSASF
jgi:hypothetical protein